MVKRILVAGLLGGLVMIGWTFVVNGIFGFRVALDMNRITNERLVYEVLKLNFTEPGRYVLDPPSEEPGLPPEGPVYSVLYGGVGHEAAGMMTLLHFPLAFLVPAIGAWMLSLGSARLLSSYPRKVLFFAVLGLLIGLTSRLTDFGIGSYPLRSALILFVHEIALWTAMGLVVAWSIRPVEDRRPV